MLACMCIVFTSRKVNLGKIYRIDENVSSYWFRHDIKYPLHGIVFNNRII